MRAAQDQNKRLFAGILGTIETQVSPADPGLQGFFTLMQAGLLHWPKQEISSTPTQESPGFFFKKQCLLALRLGQWVQTIRSENDPALHQISVQDTTKRIRRRLCWKFEIRVSETATRNQRLAKVKNCGLEGVEQKTVLISGADVSEQNFGSK